MDAMVGVAIAEDGEIPAIRVVLSERNLRTLLATIEDENNDVIRFIPEQGMLLIIASESNSIHYKKREAGLMSEDVELQLLADEFDPDATLYLPPDMELE